VLLFYGNNQPTTVHYVESALLLVWLGGGIYGFTNIILFQSSHFDGIRTLTVVESTYLLTQILTTIGYGDITPAMPRGQVVVAVYILCSIIVVTNMFTQVVELIESKLSAKTRFYAEIAFMDDDEQVKQRLAEREAYLTESARSDGEPTEFDFEEAPVLHHWPLIKSFLLYVTVAGTGILFFSLYPAEGKTFMQATYMSIVTLSTVGLGAFTATTEIGKAFSSFWMLIGVSVFGHFITTCIKYSLEMKTCWQYRAEMESNRWQTSIDQVDIDNDGELSHIEFLRFALVHAGYTSAEEVEKVHNFFRRMQPDQYGRVPLAKLQAMRNPNFVYSPRCDSTRLRSPQCLSSGRRSPSGMKKLGRHD